MNLKRNTILSAAFDQSPIRSIGPNTLETNVKTLADKQVERLLIAITSLCTALAEQFFPEETVNFQHNGFVTATDHVMQHTSRVYFHEEASRALILVTTDAIALFLKSVIHGAADLFNKDDHAELTRPQKRYQMCSRQILMTSWISVVFWAGCQSGNDLVD